MIIVEGPDGIGKTTLSKKLAEKLDLEIVHSGGPPTSSSEIIDRMIRQCMSFGKILDRATIVSEYVYGIVVRKNLLVDESVIKMFAKIMADQGWMLFYCRWKKPPRTIVSEIKSHKSADHVRMVKEKYPAICRRYDAVISEFRSMGMEIFEYVRD